MIRKTTLWWKSTDVRLTCRPKYWPDTTATSTQVCVSLWFRFCPNRQQWWFIANRFNGHSIFPNSLKMRFGWDFFRAERVRIKYHSACSSCLEMMYRPSVLLLFWLNSFVFRSIPSIAKLHARPNRDIITQTSSVRLHLSPVLVMCSRTSVQDNQLWFLMYSTFDQGHAFLSQSMFVGRQTRSSKQIHSYTTLVASWPASLSHFVFMYQI